MTPDNDNRDPALTAALRRLAAEDATTGASEMVEARLLREVRAIAAARRRRNYVTAVALAAAVILAVSVSVWRPAPGDPALTANRAPAEVTTAFLPLIHSRVPLTGGQIVRMELPRSALASFGLASIDSPRSSSATVLADVIVGEDGLARAVRFVHSSKHQEQ